MKYKSGRTNPFHALCRAAAGFCLAGFAVTAFAADETADTPLETEAPIDQGVLEPPFKPGEEQLGEVEIKGLVVDETLTKIGHQFMDEFHRLWHPPEGIQYTITIRERSNPTRGSIVVVLLNDQVVGQAPLNPNRQNIEELAKNVANFLTNRIQTQKQTSQELDYY